MWMMTQTWRDLLFLHWPVDPAKIRYYVPAELELDLYDNQAWVGIVLFKAKGTRPRFLPPIPGSANFLEVNVRTYVKYKNRSGVYFFSLDADSKMAVEIASFANFLPYRKAKMALRKKPNKILFKSRTVEKAMPSEKISLKYSISEEQAVSTNLEQWLTERYCLWTKPGQHLLRLDIEHDSWKLKYIKGRIIENTMAPYLGINFSNKSPMAHYADMKNVSFYPPIIEK
ncbi:YqjF family protein [Metaplanococcus flavidus]|uniref:YqjF family protein n=1 Tax=Metaplanococcus flavidus TaxID=569883 RepID=A0ABW3L5W4_9BACL